MALWLFRAGSRGEYEKKFLDENRVFITWGGLNHDLSKIRSRQELISLLEKTYPDSKRKKILNHASQIWSAVHEMKPGDWIVTPSKLKPAIHLAEVTGGYEYNPKAADPFHHSRTVKWFAIDIPRSAFAPCRNPPQTYLDRHHHGGRSIISMAKNILIKNKKRGRVLNK